MDNNVIIRTFKIENISDPFDINKKYDGNVLVDINWSENGDDIYQSTLLNKQIKINLMTERQLENICKTDPTDISVMTDYKLKRGYVFTIDDKELMKKTCNTYLSRVRTQYDVLSRDHDVFTAVHTKKDINVDIYAVVAIQNGIYVGHVYTWISPIDKSIAVMIGIRSNPMMPFFRMMGAGVSGVANYLVKGVEDFTRSKGANKIVILSPIGAMLNIAKKLGFKLSDTVTIDDIGSAGGLTRGISEDKGICRWCYVKEI